MSKLRLATALSASPFNWPFFYNEVQPEGIELQISKLHPSEMFWRQLHFKEFDVSEMSLASLIMAIERGNKDWIGLPIFTSRKFFHTGILVRADKGILKPQDLKGKRVGVPEYEQTAAVWCRGVLQHEWNVYPSEVEWFMEREPGRSHGSAIGFRPPDGVKLTYIGHDENLGELLLNGQLDALLLYINEKNLVDKSKLEVTNDKRVKYLFDQPIKEGLRFFEKERIFPINHCVVVKREIVEKDPWVCLNLYSAFSIAKQITMQKMQQVIDPWIATGYLTGMEVSTDDFDVMPYGIVENRHVLDTLISYLNEQRLTKREIYIEDVFYESTLRL